MSEKIASLPSGIDICFETFGSSDDPTVLLIMGLGGPMGWWNTEFCERLTDRGFFVIRYDNRDTARSTHLRDHQVKKTDLFRAFLGLGSAPYEIRDLADDAYGLLDHLDVSSAHLVGVSMGGMIAQTMAIDRPDRALSLTSIMSSTGRRSVGWQHPQTFPVMLAPGGSGLESYTRRAFKSASVIGSPGYPEDEHRTLERAKVTYERGWSAGGVMRHMMAVLTQPDRTKDLHRLKLPTTVIHGLADVLVDVSGGRATSLAIRDSEFIEIAGMSHDMPIELWDTFIDAIARTSDRVSTAS